MVAERFVFDAISLLLQLRLLFGFFVARANVTAPRATAALCPPRRRQNAFYDGGPPADRQWEQEKCVGRPGREMFQTSSPQTEEDDGRTQVRHGAKWTVYSRLPVISKGVLTIG